MKKSQSLLALTTFAALCAQSTATHAFSDEVGGVALNLDNRFSLGTAWRMNERSPGLVGIGNGGRAFSTNSDDGNLAFEPHQIVAAVAKLTSDLTLTRGNWGAFLRGSYLLDDKLHNHDFFDLDDYGAGTEAPVSEHAFKTRRVRDYVGEDADLLDAYLFGAVDVAHRSLSVRLGRQVINWGESTFVLHGINSLLAFDQAQVRVPGFELDEVLIPTENLWVSLGLVENLSLEAFYQLKWRPTQIDPSATYWSSNDFAGIAGTRANLGFGRVDENAPAGTVCAPPGPPAPFSCVPFGSTVPRAPDRKPGDDGQWGVKFSTLIAPLRDLDFSVYAMNYHSRLPLYSGTSRTSAVSPASTANYFVEYPEDIQLYGLSANSTIGDWSVQGEYSYKRDQPLQIDDVELLLAGLGAPSQISPFAGATLGNQYLRGWRRFDVSQADLGVTRLLPPMRWLRSDQLLLLGEAGMTYVHDLPAPQQLAFEGPATYTPNPSTAALNPAVMAGGLPTTPFDRYATPFSWGYKLVARLTYNNVFNLFNLEPTLRFDHDVDGTSPTPIINFVEDRKTLTAALNAIYRQALQMELGYTRYFGANTEGGLGSRNLLADRDFLEFALKYSF